MVLAVRSDGPCNTSSIASRNVVLMVEGMAWDAASDGQAGGPMVGMMQ